MSLAYVRREDRGPSETYLHRESSDDTWVNREFATAFPDEDAPSIAYQLYPIPCTSEPAGAYNSYWLPGDP